MLNCFSPLSLYYLLLANLYSLTSPLLRLGSPADGGYLIPDYIPSSGLCLSPGVGDQSDFEEMLASRFNFQVHICDLC